MTDWTSGYVSDIGYTYGYYPELNPHRLQLAMLHSGWHCPKVSTACELGFGQGLSTNIHAAAASITWYGTDFNPAQAAFAQELAQASGATAHLYDQAFADFCTRPDLPEFDYIGIHGIWSWISPENRAVMVDFIRRKLKVGGILYISYNTQPGWAAMVPMRDLLTKHAEVLGADGQGIIHRIDSALAFTDKLLAVNPAYVRANPQVANRISKIKDQNRNYLAHEYFNRDWEPMAFAKMTDWLQEAKLQYACSAHYMDQIDLINLSQEQQNLLAEIPDPMFRQTVRDFCVNQQFRRDYWVKGARRMNNLAQVLALRGQRLLLVQPRAEVSLKVTGNLGEATMQESIYNPILDFLGNHQITTIGQLEQEMLPHKINFGKLLQAVVLLCGTGALAPAQDEEDIRRANPTSQRLNQYLMEQSRGSSDLSYLASPVTGGGFTVNRFQQLFLNARKQGKKKPGEWAQYLWDLLQLQGQKLAREGKTLETPEENLAELTRQAQTFADKQLAILKALQIA